MQRKTKVINLLAGPGTSKSTTAAGIFHRLKTMGHSTELIQEYAKLKTWLSDSVSLSFQPYVTIKQAFKQFAPLGQVDYIVTDSPIILGLVYKGDFGCTKSFDTYVVELFNEFDNINFFLERNTEIHPYVNSGRNQTEAEATQKDKEIIETLDLHNIEYERVPVLPDSGTVELILNRVLGVVQK